MRFMHKWLGFSLFPRNDFRTIRNDELKLLYAMVKRRKVLPIKFMMKQWTVILELKGNVGCTSLVTRIAKNLVFWEMLVLLTLMTFPVGISTMNILSKHTCENRIRMGNLS